MKSCFRLNEVSANGIIHFMITLGEKVREADQLAKPEMDFYHLGSRSLRKLVQFVVASLP